MAEKDYIVCITNIYLYLKLFCFSLSIFSGGWSTMLLITDVISRWPALFHERQVVSHNSSSQNIPQRDRKHVVRYCTVSYSEICLTDIFYLSVSLLRSRQNSRELSPQTFWNLFSMGLMGWSQDCWRYTKQQLSLERSSHSKKF